MISLPVFSSVLTALAVTVACPSGWTTFQGTHLCYLSLGNLGTGSFQYINSTCWSYGADVVMPKTSQENDYVKQIMDDKGFTDVYLGLSDFEENFKWRWADGNLLTTTGFSDFSPEEPNKYFKNENCVALQKKTIYAGGIFWNDVRCNTASSVVCQRLEPMRECPRDSVRLPSSPTCYYNAGIFTYDKGESFCSRIGLDMPMPKSAASDQQLVYFLNRAGYSEIFIGLRQKSISAGWIWEDGETLVSSGYDNWGFTSSADLFCVFLASRYKYEWYSKNCTIETLTICQCHVPLQGFTISGEICPFEIVTSSTETMTESFTTQPSAKSTVSQSTDTDVLNTKIHEVYNSTSRSTTTTTSNTETINTATSTTLSFSNVTLNATSGRCSCNCNHSEFYVRYSTINTIKLEETWPSTDEELKTYRNGLSAHQRKLACGDDDRPSARYIGYTGLVIITAIVLFLIVLDLIPSPCV